MKIIIRLVGWLFGERSELKTNSAIQENKNIFEILRSDYRWRKVQDEYIKQYPRCELCQEESNLEVHHIIPWHKSIKGRYDESNLICLCRYCHFRYGHWRNWQSYNIGIVGLSEYISKIRLYNKHV